MKHQVVTSLGPKKGKGARKQKPIVAGRARARREETPNLNREFWPRRKRRNRIQRERDVVERGPAIA